MPFPTNPVPLGKITPDGAGVLAVTNISQYFDFPGTHLSDLLIQAATSNSGLIYICNSAEDPTANNYANCLRILTAGAFYSAGSPTGIAQVDPGNYYIFAPAGTDFAIGEARHV